MLDKNKLNDIFSISSKKLNHLNIFWIGFIIYTLSWVISRTANVNIITCQLIQAIGLVLILPTSISLIQFRIKNYYLKIIFPIYCIWLVSVIFRGINFNYNSVKKMLFSADYGIFLYFSPLMLLFPKNLNFYKKLFDIIIIFGLLFMACNIFLIRILLTRSFATQDTIEYLGKFLSIPCGFLLLNYLYFNNKKRLLAGVIIIITLLFSIYNGRRGLSFICLSIMCLFYFLYLNKTKNKILITYLSLLIIIGVSIYFTRVYKLQKSSLFGFIAQRGEEDTRTDVELYFYDDMKTKDWIMGKGINGEYFCPNIEEDQLTNYRDLIETGYLQIILKGGLISLILYFINNDTSIYFRSFLFQKYISKIRWLLDFYITFKFIPSNSQYI